MKTLIVKVIGAPSPGDLVILGYSGPRGGYSASRYRTPLQSEVVSKALQKYNEDWAAAEKEAISKGEPVPPVPSFEPPPVPTGLDVLNALAFDINRPTSEWCGESHEFKATVNAGVLYVQCSDRVDNVVFSYVIEGAKTLQLELKELGRTPSVNAPVTGVPSVPLVPNNGGL